MKNQSVKWILMFFYLFDVVFWKFLDSEFEIRVSGLFEYRAMPDSENIRNWKLESENFEKW